MGNEGATIPAVIQKSSCGLWNTHERVVFLLTWQKKTVEICSAGWWGRAYWENFQPFNTGCQNMIKGKMNGVKTKNKPWNQKINLVFLGGSCPKPQSSAWSNGYRVGYTTSVAQSFPTLCDPMDCSMLGFPVHHQLLELAQTHAHQVGDAIQPSYPQLTLLLLSSIFPSIRVFSNESVLRIRWPKYWSFSFSTSPANKYSGLISFRIDWFDLFAVQGTLKSFLQHHSSKAPIL